MGTVEPREQQDKQPPAITVELTNVGVAKITLNRPKKKNALTESMYKELSAMLRSFAKNKSVKVCFITGSGDFYSAGNDLSNFSKVMHPLTMAKQAKDILEEFVDSFISLGKPLIVAVNGPAIGIAVTLLGLCDRVYCCETAYFKTPFAELGQAPEGCSSFTFPRIMGESTAHEMLWDGKVLSSTEAQKTGLVYSVLACDRLEAVALQYCEELAAQAEPQSYIVREGLTEKLRLVNRSECAVLQRKWVSKECFEALAKFLDTRRMRLPAFFLRQDLFLNYL